MGNGGDRIEELVTTADGCAVVVGSSGHAISVIDVIESTKLYRIVGLLDRFERKGTGRLGYSILGGESDVDQLARRYGNVSVFVAIGDNWDRSQSVGRLREQSPALNFPAIVHPAAHIGRNVEVGAGSIIMAGAIVNAHSRIGKFCIVNTAASIDHECEIGDFASIGPGATLGGRAKVAQFSAICLGAKISHRISIGEHTVIGAGAVLLSDIPDRRVAYGVPARIVRAREVGERYL